MRSTVIHIGFHKSASTYLQEYVFPRVGANYLFLAGYKRQVLNSVQSADAFDQKLLEDWIERETASACGSTARELTILSHEELSGHPHGYKTIDPFAVAANLKQAFPSARIIIIIRNQFSYLLSLYTFRVAIKGHESRRLERFLREEGALGLFEKLEYDRIVDRYISLFGKPNVLVLPMELLVANAAAFNDRITEFLGVSSVPPAAPGRVNESTKLAGVIQFWRPINAAFAAFLKLLELLHIEFEEEYRYGWLRYAFYAFKRKVTSRCNRRFRSARKIRIEDYSEYGSLSARYASSNARLQELIDFSLKECGYPFSDSDTQAGAFWLE